MQSFFSHYGHQFHYVSRYTNPYYPAIPILQVIDWNPRPTFYTNYVSNFSTPITQKIDNNSGKTGCFYNYREYNTNQTPLFVEEIKKQQEIRRQNNQEVFLNPRDDEKFMEYYNWVNKFSIGDAPIEMEYARYLHKGLDLPNNNDDSVNDSAIKTGN
jgi:hypothetical protein